MHGLMALIVAVMEEILQRLGVFGVYGLGFRPSVLKVRSLDEGEEWEGVQSRW